MYLHASISKVTDETISDLLSTSWHTNPRILEMCIWILKLVKLKKKIKLVKYLALWPNWANTAYTIKIYLKITMDDVNPDLELGWALNKSSLTVL